MTPLLLALAFVQGKTLTQAPDAAQLRNQRITPIVRVYQQAAPAVCFIQSSGVRRENRQDIFGRMWSERNRFGVSGSGVVIRKEGFIITNYHVVRDAREILVTFGAEYDDATYKASVISYVEREDLALIKIQRDRDFETIPLGTSEDLMPGETAIAIGNPYGQTISVNAGIISGLHRNVPIPQPEGNVIEFPEMIQTDAAINSGNSGGPLLNINGELIGINTAINNQAQNIGFAIPVDRVRSVLENQLLSPETAPAWLGFEIEPGDHLCIAKVVPGSPAAKAGLRPGDCIVSVAGEKVVNQDEYRVARVNLAPLEAAELQVESKGAKRRVRLEPWDREDGVLFERFGARVDSKVFPQRGVWLRVKDVRPGGPAAALGLEAEDLIDALKPRSGGRMAARWVDTPESLAGLISSLPKGTEILMDVLRDADKDGGYSSDEVLRGVLTLD